MKHEEMLQFIRHVIAVCKEEVETSIGPDAIEMADSGSPWGRAFIRLCQEIDREKKDS